MGHASEAWNAVCQRDRMRKGGSMPDESDATVTIQAGRPAPDAMLVDASGNPVHLREQWEAAPKALALIFLRHFG